MKILYMLVAIIGVCGSSEGMFSFQRNIEVRLDTKKYIAINNRTQSPIPCEVVGDQVVLNIPIVSQHIAGQDIEIETELNSLLSSLDSGVFGIKPSMDFVLSENAIGTFNSDLFAKLGYTASSIFHKCSSEQKKKLIEWLIACNGYSLRNYLKFSSCIPGADSETIEKDKESLELYFDNVVEKMEILIGMLSFGITPINQGEQYKLITMGLIVDNEEGNHENKSTFKEYDQECKNRLTVLVDLAAKGEVTLNINECYTIVESLNKKNVVKYLLLSDFCSKGLSLIKERNGVFCRPDLKTTVETLNKTDVSILKNDIPNLLLYMATMYCLSNIDNLAFPMSVYDSFSEDEKTLRDSMIALAKDKIDRLMQ